MQKSFLNNINLKKLLSTFVNGNALYADVRLLVDISHKFAAAYIQTKIKLQKFDVRKFGISVDEFAYDAIADLFKTSDKNNLAEIKKNFERLLDDDRFDEAECISEFRRLIFSAVNHYIFRISRAHDPGLSKIIRNLKGAAKNNQSFSLKRVWNEAYICLDMNEKNSHLPLIPHELLIANLNGNVLSYDVFNSFLKSVAEIFGGQKDFRKEYPLLELAYILREYLTQKNLKLPEVQTENELSEYELRDILAQIHSKVKKKIGIKYLDSGKLQPQMLECYQKTVVEILSSEFIREDCDGKCFYDFLLRHIPELTIEEYQTKHRTKLEYFAKVSRKEFLKMVQKEF